MFFIFQYKGTLSEKDLQASTLVGLNRENPVLDPIDLLNLDN